MTKEKRITIHGIGGFDTFTVPKIWDRMSPVARVLYIHEKCKNATKGQTFDVVKEEC